MHIVLEYHYAYADFNPQVSGSNDTLFYGIKCHRIVCSIEISISVEEMAYVGEMMYIWSNI